MEEKAMAAGTEATASEQEKKTEEVLSKAENTILEEAYKMIQDEVSEIRGNINREISLHNLESRKEVLAEREHYVDAVFSEVKKALIRFKKTDDYPKYILRAYEEAKKSLGDVTRIYVSRPDVDIVKKVISDVEVRQDLRILIGGIIAENDGLIADYTFDKKLKKEREKFKNVTLLSYDD